MSKMPVNENNVPEESTVSDFPPEPADADPTRAIVLKAYKKIYHKAIEEAGCAVCGELKPLQKMSRLKSVNFFLGILEVLGRLRKSQKHGNVFRNSSRRS